MYINEKLTEAASKNEVTKNALSFVDMLGGAIIFLVLFMAVPFTFHLFQGNISSDFFSPAPESSVSK